MNTGSRTALVWLSIPATVVLLLVATGALLCWEYGDDYLNKIVLVGVNPIRYCWDLYFVQDGRHLSPAGFVQMFLVKYSDAPPAVFFYTILLYASCFFIYNAWRRDISASHGSWMPGGLLFAAVISIALWPLYKDVLYWLTGGYYLLALCQAVILFILVRYYIASAGAISISGKIVTALGIFLMSLNSQNIMLPAIIVFGMYLLWKLVKTRRIDWGFAFVVLLPVFLAMLITNLAPGNFQRLHREQPDGAFSAAAHAKAVVMMYLKCFSYSKIAILGGLSFGLLIPALQSEAPKREAKWYFTRAFIFVLLAAISLLPFIIAPALARIRVYFFAIIFLAIAACYVGAWCSGFLHKRLLQVIPITAFILYGIVFFSRQLIQMHSFGKEVETRKQYLESRRGSAQPVYYPKLELPETLHLIRWADAEMYGDWNKTKEYFELADYIEVGANELPR